MRNIINLSIGLLLVIVVNSCSNDDECTPVTLGITSLEVAYGCINTPYQMDIDLSDDFTIIRSQTVFNDLVTGDCTPEIDFEAYDLIIGKKGLTNGFDTINYDGLVKNCDNGQLYLTVSFVLNATDIAPNVTYHALVPKLAENEIVNVSIVTIN
ncbi:hypothetical protein WNY78_08745 [Psychroserpens sp. AS72]|uniref:hypothetical protein n=1 Tax=Psychroserpens sp. AS72 TaxID=3135775 RepID=UPI003179AD5B